jgi:hypothetical protein
MECLASAGRKGNSPGRSISDGRGRQPRAPDGRLGCRAGRIARC